MYYLCVIFFCLSVLLQPFYTFYSLNVVGMFWLLSGRMMSLGQPPTVVAPPSSQAVGGTSPDFTQQ